MTEASVPQEPRFPSADLPELTATQRELFMRQRELFEQSVRGLLSDYVSGAALDQVTTEIVADPHLAAMNVIALSSQMALRVAARGALDAYRRYVESGDLTGLRDAMAVLTKVLKDSP